MHYLRPFFLPFFVQLAPPFLSSCTSRACAVLQGSLFPCSSCAICVLLLRGPAYFVFLPRRALLMLVFIIVVLHFFVDALLFNSSLIMLTLSALLVPAATWV